MSDGEIAPDFTAKEVVADCESSLERLETDRIDLLLLHSPPEEVYTDEELVEVLKKLKTDGKILAWGSTVGGVEHARMAVTAEADAICLPYNLLWSDDLHDLSCDLDVASCGVLARSPLAYGLLSGRWSESRTFSELDQRRYRWSPNALRTRVRQVNRLRFLVHGEVTSLAAAALRYVLSNSMVTSMLVGARSLPQIKVAADQAGKEPYLPEDDMVRLPQVLAAAGV